MLCYGLLGQDLQSALEFNGCSISAIGSPSVASTPTQCAPSPISCARKAMRRTKRPVWVTTAKRCPFAAAARMLASAIPTTGRSSKAASSSAPEPPKALTMDHRVGTLRELRSQRVHGTGSLVDFRFVGQEGAPTVRATHRCGSNGAFSRAISAMGAVSGSDVFGLITIRCMRPRGLFKRDAKSHASRSAKGAAHKLARVRPPGRARWQDHDRSCADAGQPRQPNRVR